MNAVAETTPPKLYPCWVCDRRLAKKPRHHCSGRGNPCVLAYRKVYGPGGRPDDDETSIYRERMVEATMVQARLRSRERIVRGYVEGITNAVETVTELVSGGFSSSRDGAAQQIHRELERLGLKSPFNRRPRT